MPKTATRRSLTQRVVSVWPKAADLVDAVFVAGLGLVALLGFGSTFDSLQFLVVAAIAIVVGLVAAHLTHALGWPWLAGLGLGVVFHFMFGGAVALRANVINGVVPSGQTLGDLAGLAVGGWKQLLTTLPPVAGNSPFLVLLWLLGLFGAIAGYMVARAKTSPQLALLVPTALFVLVILLGGVQPSALLIQGLGFAVLTVSWVVVRTNRRRQLIGTGTARLSRLISGVVLVAIALAAGWFAGPVLPGTFTVRNVLRTYIQPPIDVSQYPSPLPGFVKFASPTRQQFFNVQLATVTGAPTGARLRLAVLDQYTGLGWSASGTSVYGSGFRRVGSVLPVKADGQPTDITVTLTPEFASLAELRNWVPSLGPSSSVSFQGTNADSHLNNLAYDTDKGQVLITDGAQGDETVSLTTYPVPILADNATPIAAGMVMVPNSASDFMSGAIANLSGSADNAWERLMNVGRSFAQGYWSDGSKPGEGFYLPGDGQGRLQTFMDGQQFIGSDEQYAAAFALVANRLGYPARVVFGANIGTDGTVMGKDVIVWVEVETSDGWAAVPTELYIPDRNRTPEQIPPDRRSDNQATQVPPPNPAQPPGTLDDLTDQANAGRGQTPPNAPAVLPAWVRPAIYVGISLLGVASILTLLGLTKLARAKRRRRHGSPVRQIAAGWQELLDRARDTGITVVIASLTHKEQAAYIGSAPLAAMVTPTDRAMFGPMPPDAQASAAYWRDVDQVKTAMLAGKGSLRRLMVRINPRSLLPLVPVTHPVTQSTLSRRARRPSTARHDASTVGPASTLVLASKTLPLPDMPTNDQPFSMTVRRPDFPPGNQH